MEYKPDIGEPEDFSVWEDSETELEWKLNREASREDARKNAAEEETGPGTEYWLP